MKDKKVIFHPHFTTRLQLEAHNYFRSQPICTSDSNVLYSLIDCGNSGWWHGIAVTCVVDQWSCSMPGRVSTWMVTGCGQVNHLGM